jgi:hypothetical protein
MQPNLVGAAIGAHAEGFLEDPHESLVTIGPETSGENFTR